MYDRRWCVVPVRELEDLAEKLARLQLPLCAGFQCRGYFWLNARLSEGDLPEYFAVKRTAKGLHEVATVFPARAFPEVLKKMRSVAQGGMDGQGSPFRGIVQSAFTHGECPLCMPRRTKVRLLSPALGLAGIAGVV